MSTFWFISKIYPLENIWAQHKWWFRYPYSFWPNHSFKFFYILEFTQQVEIRYAMNVKSTSTAKGVWTGKLCLFPGLESFVAKLFSTPTVRFGKTEKVENIEYFLNWFEQYCQKLWKETTAVSPCRQYTATSPDIRSMTSRQWLLTIFILSSTRKEWRHWKKFCWSTTTSRAVDSFRNSIRQKSGFQRWNPPQPTDILWQWFWLLAYDTCILPR